MRVQVLPEFPLRLWAIYVKMMTVFMSIMVCNEKWATPTFLLIQRDVLEIAQA